MYSSFDIINFNDSESGGLGKISSAEIFLIMAMK
jgi:hypothetical protein